MAVTHGTPTRNAVADAVVDRIDLGTGTAAGVLKIRASSTVLATIALANPAFGSASAGAAAMAGLPRSDSAADASGTPDNFQIVDRDGTIIFSGTAGIAGSGPGGSNPDIVLDASTVTINQVVTVNTATYTAPA